MAKETQSTNAAQVSGEEVPKQDFNLILAEKDKEIKSLETEIEELKARLMAQEPAPLVEKIGLDFKFRGEDYKFADDAPDSILFEGEARTQADLAKDEDAISQLIGAEHPLIQKK